MCLKFHSYFKRNSLTHLSKRREYHSIALFQNWPPKPCKNFVELPKKDITTVSIFHQRYPDLNESRRRSLPVLVVAKVFTGALRREFSKELFNLPEHYQCNAGPNTTAPILLLSTSKRQRICLGIRGAVSPSLIESIK